MTVVPLSLLLLCFSAVFGVITLGYYMRDAGKRRVAKRARRIGAVQRGRRSATVGPQLRRQSNGGLDAAIQRLIPRPDALRARLAASGSPMSIGRYGLICIVIGVATAILMAMRHFTPMTTILTGLAAGGLLPHLVVGSRIKKRRAKFCALFPEAIGLIVRGLKAGLPFADTLLVVGREVADPVGEEFRRMSDQVRLGQQIEEAMWGVARRIDLAEFNFLIITLSVQRETGGNLAATLENLEEMLRRRQQMRLKVKAMSSEARASAGIIGSLPFVMSTLLFFVSHDYIMQLFITHMGHMMLLFGGGMLAGGVVVMSRMVKFDI